MKSNNPASKDNKGKMTSNHVVFTTSENVLEGKTEEEIAMIKMIGEKGEKVGEEFMGLQPPVVDELNKRPFRNFT